jgi:hypothetical protein
MAAMNAFQIPLLIAATGLVVAAGLGGREPADAAPRAERRDCFPARDVNGFSPVDRDRVDIRVGANRHYRLDLTGYCPDVDWSFRIALRTRGGSSWICQGMDAELIVPSPTGTERCLVSAVTRLTPEEVEEARRRR